MLGGQRALLDQEKPSKTVDTVIVKGCSIGGLKKKFEIIIPKNLICFSLLCYNKDHSAATATVMTLS